MKVRYTRSSLAQLNKILAHIEEHSPQGVRNVQARIQEVIALIAAAPFIGRQTRKPNVRRFNTHPYPYLIFYQVTGSEIIIRRIRHGARKPE